MGGGAVVWLIRFLGAALLVVGVRGVVSGMAKDVVYCEFYEWSRPVLYEYAYMA